MAAKELKWRVLVDRDNYIEFHVIGFSPDGKHWWHVHEDEEVPEDWALKPVPSC